MTTSPEMESLGVLTARDKKWLYSNESSLVRGRFRDPETAVKTGKSSLSPRGVKGTLGCVEPAALKTSQAGEMDDKQGLRGEDLKRADEDISFSNAPPHLEIAWMQVRIGWQSVPRTRLDQEKLDAIASIIRYYRETGQPDRRRFDFEQVLLRLVEEHESRSKELERGARRSARVQKSTMRIVRDNDDAWMQDRRVRADETPKIIAEWKDLMDMLFAAPGSDTATEKTGT